MLDNKLIESALQLTGKTTEDMNEKTSAYIGIYGDDDDTILYEYDFSIEKFCYYLLSPEFIEKYLDTLYQYAKISKPERLRIIAGRFGDAIFLYQSGNKQPLIDLLSKI